LGSISARAKGARADGLRYEQKVRDYLLKHISGTVLYQPWLHFEDDNGPGWACPDFLLIPAGREEHKIILDAKRTATWRAEEQLLGLYLPLLSALEPGTKFTTVQVAKNTAGRRTELLGLEAVLALPPSDTVFLWHWRP
jgi:hypothetical protein